MRQCFRNYPTIFSKCSHQFTYCLCIVALAYIAELLLNQSIGGLQLPMESVPITTDVVSSNLDQDEVYNIKVCQWLATGWWFSPGPPVSSTNKTDRHNITEILLKVVLKSIKQTKQTIIKQYGSGNYEYIFIYKSPIPMQILLNAFRKKMIVFCEFSEVICPVFTYFVKEYHLFGIFLKLRNRFPQNSIGLPNTHSNGMLRVCNMYGINKWSTVA